MTIANKIRRSVMLLAWAAKRAEPARTFSACLKGAWAYEKRAVAKARKMLSRARGRADGSRMLQLSPSLITCPTYAAAQRERYAGRAHWNNGRLAMMGIN